MQKNGLVVTRDGRRIHYKDGLLHREDGPAVVLPNGDAFFYQNGLLHREGKPCSVLANGGRVWGLYGVPYREDGGPVVVSKDGKKLWYSETNGLVSWIPVAKQERPAPPQRADQKQMPTQAQMKEDAMTANAQITPTADELLKKTVIVIDILEQAKKLGILVKVVKRRDTEMMYYFQDPDNDSAFGGVEMPVDIRSMCGEENAAKFDAYSMAVTKMIASRSARLMASIRQKLTADEKSILGI
jgi:hypothetical protein